MLKKIIISVFVLFAGTMLVEAQNANNKPPTWIYGYFKDLDNSYIEVVSAEGYDLDNARNKAASEVINKRSLATGRRSDVEVNGSQVVVKGNDNLTVKSRVIDEYSEKLEPGRYKVYLLMQTAKNPDNSFESVSVTNKYPFSASVFIPGMAQIKKGSKGKGIAFIASEVVFVGGIIAFENMRSSYVNKINSTHNASLKQQYTQNSNTCATMRNISIAGAAAVYVWNIIDGIVAKGDKQVMYGDARLQLSPYVTPESTGIALNINF